MNISRYALATIAGFIFVFVYEYVVHGILLLPTYEQTPQLWRPETEMPSYIPFMNGMQLLITATLCFIYTRHHEGKGIGEGIRFGLMVGTLVGLGAAASYAWMPISLELAGYWFATTIVEMTVLGALFALIYKNK